MRALFRKIRLCNSSWRRSPSLPFFGRRRGKCATVSSVCRNGSRVVQVCGQTSVSPLTKSANHTGTRNGVYRDRPAGRFHYSRCVSANIIRTTPSLIWCRIQAWVCSETDGNQDKSPDKARFPALRFSCRPSCRPMIAPCPNLLCPGPLHLSIAVVHN